MTEVSRTKKTCIMFHEEKYQDEINSKKYNKFQDEKINKQQFSRKHIQDATCFMNKRD